MSAGVDILSYFFIPSAVSSGMGYQLALVKDPSNVECSYTGYTRQNISFTIGGTGVRNSNEIIFPEPDANQGAVVGVIVKPGDPATLYELGQFYTSSFTPGNIIRIGPHGVGFGGFCPVTGVFPPSLPGSLDGTAHHINGSGYGGTGYGYNDAIMYLTGVAGGHAKPANCAALIAYNNNPGFENYVTQHINFEIYDTGPLAPRARNVDPITFGFISTSFFAVGFYENVYSGNDGTQLGKLIGSIRTDDPTLTTGQTIAAHELDVFMAVGNGS